MYFFPDLLQGFIAFLLLMFGQDVFAEYLDSPEFVDQINIGEPMLQGNGITGSSDGRIFATTQPGNLWIFSGKAEPIAFTPQPWIGVGGEALSTRNTFSPVVKEDENGQILYVLHVVVDVDPVTSQPIQSRVFGVDPDTGTVLWSSVFEDSVAVGTPAIGRDYVYVSLNSATTNRGRLSLLQISPFNQVFVVANYESQSGRWGPPSVVDFPPESTWTEAVVWGDSFVNGNSPQGSTYILKVDNEGPSPVQEVVTDATGSTVTAPALGTMRQNGNAIDWNVATGNFAGRFNVWREVDWSTMLGEAQVPPGDEVAPSWSRVGSQFSQGQQPMQVSPLFSSTETSVFVAGAGGGLAGWEVRRGRRQWDWPTSAILSQPVMHVPGDISGNENSGVLYSCDRSGVIRQITADDIGTVAWTIDYCEINSLGASCPQVSANIFLSTNGNRLYVPNEEGSIFIARVAAFETPQPTSMPTLPPREAPTATPTTVTEMPTSYEATTGSPSFSPDESGSESNESKTSGLGDDGLYILLGVLIAALCMCICGASFIFKNRKKSRESEQKIKEEMAAVHRWKSNKKMYEAEIKELEHDTMQELSSGSPKRPGTVSEVSTPETVEAESEPGSPDVETQVNSQISGWKPEHSRSHSRSRTSPRTQRLGSISESVDEERASPIPIESVSSKSDIARNLAIQFASEDNDVSVSEEVHDNKSISKAIPSHQKVQEKSTSQANGKATPAMESIESTQSSTEDTKDAKSTRVIPTSSSDSQPEKYQSQNDDKKATTTQKPLFGLVNLEWWNDSDDNKSEFNSQLSGTTEEPGRISARFEPQIIDNSYNTDDDGTVVSSIVSGLSARSQHTQEPGVINRSSQSIPNNSIPSDLMSVDSGSIYLDDNTVASPPQSPPEIQKPQGTPPTPLRVDLAPPDGASVIATESVLSSHSGPSLNTSNYPTTASTAKPNSYIPNKYSTAAANVRKIPTTPKPLVESHYGGRPTAFEGKSESRGRPRAGLFSRREIQDNRSVSNQSISEYSESESSSNAVMTHGRDDTPNNKPKAQMTKKKGGSGKQSGADDTPWNSFLNQLAMAEQEFFNPKLQKSSSKTRAVSPPPPPPPPESESSDESDEPPPPPAYSPPSAGRIRVDNSKRQYGRTRSKQSFPKPLPPADTYSRRSDGDSEKTEAGSVPSSK